MFEIEKDVVVETRKQASNLQAGQYTLRRSEGFGVVEMEYADAPGKFVQKYSTQLSPERVEEIFVLIESATAEALMEKNTDLQKARRVESIGRVVESIETKEE